MRLFVYKKKFKDIFLFKIDYKMKIIIIYFFYLFTNINSFEFSNSKNNLLLNKIEIKNTLTDLINDIDNIKIINNPNQKFCKDCFEIYCYQNDLKYEIVSYNNFLNNIYNQENNFIYVQDFMINYGRTLMNKEKEIILNYNKRQKVILNIDDYENIVLKDDSFIKKIKIYNFPKICKRDIFSYIFELIEYYDYNQNLQLINWKKYSIDKLSLEEIEDLIFNIHLIVLSNNHSIEYYEEIIKEKLSYLDKKYYD